MYEYSFKRSRSEYNPSLLYIQYSHRVCPKIVIFLLLSWLLPIQADTLFLGRASSYPRDGVELPIFLPPAPHTGDKMGGGRMGGKLARMGAFFSLSTQIWHYECKSMLRKILKFYTSPPYNKYTFQHALICVCVCLANAAMNAYMQKWFCKCVFDLKFIKYCTLHKNEY